MTHLDIRWPLGLIFTVVGAILVGYAGVAPAELGDGKLLDAAWGAVLASFGGAMLVLARRAARNARPHD